MRAKVCTVIVETSLKLCWQELGLALKLRDNLVAHITPRINSVFVQNRTAP